MIKHNGPMTDEVRPTIAALDKDWGLDLALWPSPEAQLANLSDDIAYMSHDFDDVLRAGLITIDQIDELPVVGAVLREIHNQHCNLNMGRLTHELTRRLISYFVEDALVNTTSRLADVKPETAEDIRTAGQALAGHSGQAAEELAALRSFLMAYSWRHYKVNRMTSKSKKQLAALFDRLLSETNLMPTEWQDKLKDQTRAEKARIIADYVASMTDRYALLEYERILKQVLFSSDMDIFSRFADFVTVSVHQLIEDGQVTPRQAVNTEKLVVELPREESHGDLACNAAMVLAKQVSMAPRDLAGLLADKLAAHEDIAAIDIAGPGFLNITLKPVSGQQN